MELSQVMRISTYKEWMDSFYGFLVLYLIVTPLPLLHAEDDPQHEAAQASHILFLIQSGDTANALQTYQQYCRERGNHDCDLIQQMGLTLLDQGFRTRDPQIQLLTLFGAGVSANERVLYILEDGLSSPYPQLQLIALNFLAHFQNDRADETLNRAMASDNLLIRLEAAFHLASKKYATAVGQTEALMVKVSQDLIPLFPQLYATIGDSHAMKIMRKLLVHPDEKVRVETIFNVAKHGRDDLLPQIRRLATHHNIAQQEACAWALGILGDGSSISKLEILARSSTTMVKLAALRALYQLGKKEAQDEIEKIAKGKDLYAIAALGEMEGSKEVLVNLLQDDNIQVKINASMALLERGDPRCLIPLCDVLIQDARDLALLKTTSIGKSLSAWKVIPSAQENFEENTLAFEVSLGLRESILAKTIELPERDFLRLAHTLLEAQQNDLVPLTVELLENLQTPAAIELLKKHQQKVGAPLVRNYCNLALYRLKQPGPYADILGEWVTKQQNVDLIRFRPCVPWDLRDNLESTFLLTPQETSRLLVEAFEAFVETQDDKGIDLLISVIQNGNPKNKYALVGLLMRATQ
jgi:HEAT repeat protein